MLSANTLDELNRALGVSPQAVFVGLQKAVRSPIILCARTQGRADDNNLMASGGRPEVVKYLCFTITGWDGGKGADLMTFSTILRGYFPMLVPPNFCTTQEAGSLRDASTLPTVMLYLEAFWLSSRFPRLLHSEENPSRLAEILSLNIWLGLSIMCSIPMIRTISKILSAEGSSKRSCPNLGGP